MKMAVLLSGLLVAAATPSIHAQTLGVPDTMALRGALHTASGEPYEGTADLEVRLYDSADPETAVLLFSELQVAVPVVDSRFAIEVGASDATTFPTGLLSLGELFNTEPVVYATLAVNGGDELPRQPIAAHAFSFRAQQAGVAEALACEGCVDTVELTDASVTAAKLGESCGEGEVLKMLGGVWTCAPDEDEDTTYAAGDGLTLASGVFALDATSCTPGQILRRNGANDAWMCADVTLPPASEATLGAVLAGPCPSDQYVSGFDATSGAPLCATPLDTDTTYTAADGGGLELISTAFGIAAGGVTSSMVADDSLTADDLAANSVGLSELADNAVNSAKVADNTLTADDLAANSVGSSELADNAVNSAKVVDNSLTAADLAANSVDSSELVNGSVDNSHLAGDIAPSKIAGTAAVLTTTGTQIFDGGTLAIDHTNNRVAVGDSTPDTYTFKVSGTMGATGDITTGGDFRYPTAKTGYVVLEPTDFMPYMGGDDPFYKLDLLDYIPYAFLDNTNTDITLVSRHVSVPDGATITGAACFYADASAAGRLTFFDWRLRRAAPAANTGSTLISYYNLGSPPSLASPTVQTTTGTTTETAVSGGDRLWLRLRMGTADATNSHEIRFYGCRITYTTPYLRP